MDINLAIVYPEMWNVVLIHVSLKVLAFSSEEAVMHIDVILP